jgi:hypothetical protein
MMESWHSYPSIYALGHRAIEELLLDPVLVEEKIDGSQFSFARFEPTDAHPTGLWCRSKGAVLNLIAPEAMFKRACDIVNELPLTVGWTYRAEYLQKAKHNSLAYDRIPEKHLIIFDINTGEESYMSYEDKAKEAARLGLEIVPKMFEGMLTDVTQVRDFLDRISVLGGQKVEGVVIKNYLRFGKDKKVLMGKFVSEAFKEVHANEWKLSNPTQTDVVQTLIDRYKTPARWAKAVQHLREAGQITDSPRDIGNLMKEAQADIEKECADEIKDALYKWAIPRIRRACVHGLPEWYKEQLLALQFENTEEAAAEEAIA